MPPHLRQGGEASAIFSLDTQYGGGKTHALIALAHVAANARTVPNIGEFVDPSRLPTGMIRVAAFDGENADPINGRGSARLYPLGRVGIRPREEGGLREPAKER